MVLVIIIITVIMVLGVALAGVTLNANKQFNVTEKKSKATDIAEMGITHYQTLIVNDIIPRAEENTTTKLLELNLVGNVGNLSTFDTIKVNYNENFCNEFKTLFSQSGSGRFISVEGDNEYKIQPLDAVCNETNNTIIVTVVSIGKSSNSDTVPLKGTFIITQGLNNINVNDTYKPDPVIQPENDIEFDETKGNNNNIISGITNLVDSVIKGTGSLTLTASAKIENLILKGTSSVFVRGDAVFNKLSASGDSKARLLVLGDVFLKDPLGTTNGHSFDVCILGDVYYNNKIQPLPSDYALNNVCKKGPWSIDQTNGISIDYNYNPSP
jgi:hypothetical protein